jgi:hypothetical protein
VNEFLEAIATERNKTLSAVHQEENPPSTNKERKYSKSCLCKRSVQYYYLSGQKRTLLSLNTYEQRTCLSPPSSKKLQMTVAFLPLNLMKLLRPTLSCEKNGWPLNCLI